MPFGLPPQGFLDPDAADLMRAMGEAQMFQNVQPPQSALPYPNLGEQPTGNVQPNWRDAMARGVMGGLEGLGQINPRASQGDQFGQAFLRSLAGGWSSGQLSDLQQRGQVSKQQLDRYAERNKANMAATDEYRKRVSEAGTALRAHRYKMAEQGPNLSPEEQEYQQTRGGIRGRLSMGLPAEKPSGGVVANTDDAKAIAGAIIRGEQPPTIIGLYRNASPVRAELARQGYDMTKANLDWIATQKWLSSRNSPPQLRLRQAIDATYRSLDLIDRLSDDLTEYVPRSDLRLLAKGINLAASEFNALGPDAQAALRKLQTEIQNVNTEMAVVYQGGNSPTDHSMKQAENNLSADFGPTALRGNTDLLRQNLLIRNNSIASSGLLSPSNTLESGNRGEINIGGRNLGAPATPIKLVKDASGKLMRAQ